VSIDALIYIELAKCVISLLNFTIW